MTVSRPSTASPADSCSRLSLFAMLLVVGATALTMAGRFNPAPDGDGGTAAHLFQLAIVLLVPAGLAFLVTADWLQRIEAAARPALAELKALHDEWNKSLELDCVGETICATAQIINSLSAALEAK